MHLAGRRVLVAGAGVTGKSVANALSAAGAIVTMTDGNASRLAECDSLGIELAPGLTSPPTDTSLVVTSPGWRPSAPLLVAARDAGIEVIGDVELAWRIGKQDNAQPPTWLAVTGTNGKTTTVGMLSSILRSAGIDAVACGNVGFAVLDAVRAGYKVLAVELSSFQLYWSTSLAPHASVVLNLAEDHIDWHGSLSEYGAAKGAVYARTGVVVHNVDDEWSTALAAEHALRGSKLVGFALGPPCAGQLGIEQGTVVDRAFVADPERDSVGLCALSDVHPSGQHNVANALAASALARAYGVEPGAVRSGLRDFVPGAHRSVELGEVAGVRYVNDSKATNPHAAAGSLGAYASVVWIAGGQLKGASVDELVATVAPRLRAVIAMGADSDVISAAVTRHAPDVPLKQVSIHDDDPMTVAVSTASALARPGDVVVLAPAAASLDMFRDYADRGDAFTHAVGELAVGEPNRDGG